MYMPALKFFSSSTNQSVINLIKMKTRFSTIDIMAVLHDLQPLVGMRVNNVYDIDSKTYLIRLMKPDAKGVILFESGNRLHKTEFDWPKSLAPSSFSMKLRKHIKQKRLEYIRQLGADRIVEMKFGSGEVACHVFVELYDRGNVILTDYELTILNILRPRTDKDADVKYVVKEKYPVHLCRQWETYEFTEPFINDLFKDAKNGDNLRKILSPKFQYGPALLDHCLLEAGLRRDAQFGKDFSLPSDWEKLRDALTRAETIFTQIRDAPCHGYIIYKSEKRIADDQLVEAYEEFHPFLFIQHSEQSATKSNLQMKEFLTFNAALDDFFSKIETQKLDMKAIQQEKVALKKCENIRKDHETRVKELHSAQEMDRFKAELILTNKALVDRAILVIRSAVANQLSWEEISELVDDAKGQGDPAALAIKKLKLETSQITLLLSNNDVPQPDEDDSGGVGTSDFPNAPILVDIDLNLNSHQNARRYFDHKKVAAVKEQKTLESSKKAMKAAEMKMRETLKQVQVKTSIMKSRKLYWFEKFIWFFSSDDYLIIGGRDAQQNELLVKRYFRPGDIYVHADIRGAASVIIKNPVPSSATDQPIPPPRTLQEAGTMAVCYSAAWDAKVVTSAWWVRHDQVSKTAPSGEYLTTGSFMIRGKKNFLPPCQLVMGFGILFRLDEESIPKHRELKRQQRLAREESVTTLDETPVEDETELPIESGESDEEEQTQNPIQSETADQNAAEGDQNEEESNDQSSEGTDEDVNPEPDTNAANAVQDDDVEFPDVAVQLRHLTTESTDEEATVLQIGPKRPSRVSSADQPPAASVQKQKSNTGEPKRGQKQKLKKIKEKYKDQDDEERQLRMQVLGSAGGGEKEKKVAKKKGKGSTAVAGSQQKGNQQQKKGPKPTTAKEDIFVKPELEQGDSSKTDSAAAMEAPQDDVDQEEHSQWNVEIAGAQEALTGSPMDDDVLLFGVATCAPYSALSSFKYKVKLTPGTGKKGKATKTALAVFLKDRTSSQREKELLKALQDQDLARNLPGKVKVSAPQLTAAKKHK